MSTKNISRIPWIDICRGIAILLVLYGHAFTNDKQRFLIYAFHMPLFFFLSGVVSKPSTAPILSIILKNVRSILQPYFLFAVLTFVVGYFLLQQSYTEAAIMKQLYGLFYGNGNQGYLAYNVALWFLPCLFLAKVSFSLLSRYIKKQTILVGILLVVSLIGYAFSALMPTMKLFFGLETAFTAFVFFGAGYLWNQNEKIKQFVIKNKLAILIFSIVATGLFAWLNFNMYGTQIDLRMNRLNNYFYFYLGAVGGIGMCLTISMLIQKNTLLEYLGRHSLLLFVWHTLLFSYFRSHPFLPIPLDFFKPTLFIIQASAIILFTRLLWEKIRIATWYSLQKSKLFTR